MDNDKARSEFALNQIQKLYAIEQKCRDADSSYDERTIDLEANDWLRDIKSKYPTLFYHWEVFA